LVRRRTVLTAFNVGDKVEVVTGSHYRGRRGTILKVYLEGRTLLIRIDGSVGKPQPFLHYELRKVE
jgi:ribosomal protein L21E